MNMMQGTFPLGMWVAPKPSMYLFNDESYDLGNGWGMKLVPPAEVEGDEDGRHGTGWIEGHHESPYRYAIAFRYERLSETPETDLEKICAATVEVLNKAVIAFAESEPMFGDSSYQQPKIRSINFWDSGLPGEMLDLRLQAFVVKTD